MIIEFDKFVLVGTSHVAKESVNEINIVLENENYDIEAVAIELDIDRLQSILSKKKQKENFFEIIKQIGVFGYLFAKLASSMQKKVGQNLGIEPGVDMKTAYLKAREKKLPTALIDIPIYITLRKLSSIPFFKKMEMFFKLFTVGFNKKNRKKMIFDVNGGVPSQKKIDQMLDVVKNEVPLFYNILIEDRNRYMVNKLLKIKENHQGKILVVVGAGHISGMVEILKKELSYKESNFTYSFQTII